MINRLLLLFVFLDVVACRSSDQPQQIKEPTEDDAIPFRVTKDDEGELPGFLWSPTRRKASASYYYLVGEYKALSGDTKGAQSLFEAAYNLDPNPFVGAKLIASDASTGKIEEALAEAKKMVLLYPKSAQLHFLYGHILARRGFYKDAVEEYELAIDLDPLDEDIYLELSDLHQFAKDLPKAIVVVKDLVQKIPNSAKGWSRLARYYLMNGQKKQALAPAQRAFEMQGYDPEATLIYALALEANDQSKTAISLYENLYRQNPTNEELIERMVEIYRSMGNLETSLELLNELSKLPGGIRPAVQLQRAIIMWELKRFEEASRILTEVAKEFPEQMRMRYLAGMGEEKLKHFDNALAWYKGVPENSEFWPYAKLRSAVVLKEQGKVDEAIVHLRDLEKSGKSDADTYSYAASVFAEKKAYQDAIDFVVKGYAKFPEEHRLLFLKGVYEERAGKITECIATMEKLIKVDPSNSTALNYLGYILAERNERLEEARDLIERALRIKPNDGYYLDSLAWVFYQKKEYKKALEILTKAKQIIPDEGVVLEHLGDVYLKLGDQKNAEENFEAALSKQLEDKEKKRVQEKLRTVKNEAHNKAS